MTPLPHIELIARRQEDLQARYPDYLIYAGERLVGRIYCQVGGMGRTEQWYWGVQGAFTSMEIGPLHASAGAQSYFLRNDGDRRNVFIYCKPYGIEVAKAPAVRIREDRGARGTGAD